MNNIFTTCKRLMLPLHELKRYEEAHRFYHNLDHIKNMINEAERRNILSDELFIAIVFHDIIYDPRANDNEKKSKNSLTLEELFEKIINFSENYKDQENCLLLISKYKNGERYIKENYYE